MSMHTWACFDCRAGVRRAPVPERAVRCPVCGKPCERLGAKIPLPPKDKPKQWEQVRAHLREVRRRQAEMLASRRRP